MSSLETDTLRHALDAARQNGFRVVRLRQGDVSFSGVLSAVEPVEEVEEDEDAPVETGPIQTDVTAPAVGYVRFPAKLRKGDSVESGQLVAEILALGIANDVNTKGAGKIVAIHVKEGDPVEFGQPILTVERS